LKYIYLFIIPALLLTGCSSPESAKERGFALYDLQKYAEATPELEKAFAGGLDDPELVVRLAYCRSMVKSDAVSAIAILRDSALKYPAYARTYYELGFIASQFGSTGDKANIRQAIGFMRKAISCDSTEWKFKDNLGMFHYMLGNLDSAEFWFKRAQEHSPANPDLALRVSQVAELKQRQATDTLQTVDTSSVK
jgi:Flp pilus assembly protein TadD